MLLRRLQQELEHIYELRTGEDVNRYLCTNPTLLAALCESGPSEDILEKLYLAGDSDHVEVTLYLQEKLLNDLETNAPDDGLTIEYLDRFWVALEGVSHFVYFTWNCLFDRPVSLLEMELQAEVDKYVMTLACLDIHQDQADTLHQALFSSIRFLPQLDDSELSRYQTANHSAARYCRWLQDTFIKTGRGNAITREIRRFYRLAHRRKMDYIDKLPLPA